MSTPVQIANILVAQDQLAQLDQSHTVASIKREEFVSGTITRQRVCRHPLVLSAVAIAMLVLGLLTTRGIIEWLVKGGVVYTYSIMMILLYPGGLYFLYQAWRVAPMLVIQTRSGTRRLEFKGDGSKESITAFERAAQEKGYIFSRGVL